MVDFTVNWTDAHQTIEGFGASTAFCQNFSTEVADFLWSPGGLGLSMARDKISANGWPLKLPFDGTDEIDNDFSTLSQLAARGVTTLWGNIWFFNPAWQGGSAQGTLDPTHYSDAAATLTTYLDRAVAAGVYMKGVSFLNEPDISGFNDQTAWTTTQALSFIDGTLGAALSAWGTANPTWQSITGLTKPLLIMPGVSAWSAFSAWTSAVEGDSTAKALVDRYATHQYSGGGASAPGSISHAVWQSEVYDQANTTFTALINSGLVLAENVHDALTTGGATAWLAWYAQLTATNDNQGLLSFNDSANYTSGAQATAAANWLSLASNLTKRAFALGNWSKFVRPGWSRIGVTGSKSGIYGVTAFRNPSNNDFAIVVVNNSGSALSTVFSLSGAPTTAEVSPYVTTDTTVAAHGSDGNLSKGSATYSLTPTLAVSGNQFTVSVPPGVTTFAGSAGQLGKWTPAGWRLSR